MIRFLKLRRHIQEADQRSVRAWLQLDPDPGFETTVGIKQRKPPAHFPGCASHRVIRVRIVIDRTAEGIGSDGPFFKVLGPAFQSLLDDVAQQAAVTFAAPEKRTPKDLFEVVQDPFTIVANACRRFIGPHGYNRFGTQQRAPGLEVYQLPARLSKGTS